MDVYPWRPQRKVDVRKLAAGSFKPQGDGFLVRDDALYPQRFANFGRFYHQLRQEAYPLSAEGQCGAYLLEELGLQFIALNSACEIDDQFPDRSAIHPPALAAALESADDQVRQARQHDRLRQEARVLRFGVRHHPITGDEKIQQDAFVGQLQKAGVKLCLHGHVHEDRADLIGYCDPKRKLHVIGAGSFGAPARARPESTPARSAARSQPRPCTYLLPPQGRRRLGRLAVWPGDDLHSKRSYYDIVL